MFIGDIYNAPVVPITKGINPPNAKGLSSLTRPIIPTNPISFNIQQKGSTFNDLLKEVKPSGLEYMIPQSQALRFDEQSWNPYYNIEDIYSKNKSWYRNIGVGTLKAVPGAVEFFLDTFASIAGPGETSQEIHHEASRALKTLEEEFPQYWTKAYQDNPNLLNTLQGNFSGFIGDKLIKNLGFTVGAIAGGIVTDLALTPVATATAGAALPTMAAATGRSLKSAYRGISNIFKSAAKGASADDIVNLTRVTRDINRTASTLNASQKLITGAKFGLSSWMAAAGAASVEALGAKDEYEKLVSEQFRVSNGREPDEFERKLFQDNGKALANSTFAWNLPIELVSNAIQFGSILYGKSLLRSFGRPVRWNGKEFVTSSLTGKIGKEIIVDGLTEGAQEGLQSVISKGTTSKYVEQSLLGKQASSLLIDYKKGLEVLGEQEGKESVLVGALTGILTAGFGTVLSRVSPSKFKGLYTDHKEAKQVASTLNQQRDQFDSLVKGLVHSKRSNEALEKGDILNYIDEKHQELFEQVSFFKDYDLWEDRINELGNLKLEDFNNLTKLNLNEGERQSYVSSLISESRDIKKAIENVDRVAPRIQFNLPHKSRVLAKIKEDNPNLTDKEAEEQALEVVKAAYEDSRKELAKKLSLLNNRAKRAERLKSELSEFVNENTLDTILVSGTEGLKKDLQTRKEQLESLLSRENLSQPAQLYNAEFKRELKEIEEKIQIIESSDNEVDKESKIFKLKNKLLPLNFVRDFQDLKRLSKLQGISEEIETFQDPVQVVELAEEEVIQAEASAVEAEQVSQIETSELQNFDSLGSEEKINKAYEIVSKLKNGDDLTESEELLYKAYGDEFDRIYEEKQDEVLSFFEEVKPEDSLKSKKADIERRRQEELRNVFRSTDISGLNVTNNNQDFDITILQGVSTEQLQRKYKIGYNFASRVLENISKINAKYDAELKALEPRPTEVNKTLEEKRADIERRRQEELDNLFSETQASTDKQLNTPVQKLSKEEVSKNIETAKQQNKDLIEELENPEFLNDEKRNDEWDKKADELSYKLPQGVSFRITDGKVDFFDNQSYREKGFGKTIVQVSVSNLHNKTEKFEVGDNLQVQDGARAIPAIVTKVNEHGKILEAKHEDGKIIISRGNIITLAPINARLKINAKYDAEIDALGGTTTSSDKKADIERRRQEKYAEIDANSAEKIEELERRRKETLERTGSPGDTRSLDAKKAMVYNAKRRIDELLNKELDELDTVEDKIEDIKSALDYILTRKYKGNPNRKRQSIEVGEKIAKKIATSLSNKGLIKENGFVYSDLNGKNLGSAWSVGPDFPKEFKEGFDAELKALEVKEAEVSDKSKK
jgi:hypothetical protein